MHKKSSSLAGINPGIEELLIRENKSGSSVGLG
jgi:hypothetical protein